MSNRFSIKDKPVKIAGTCRLRLTTASGGSGFYFRQLAISPLDSSALRLVSMSDTYDLYRFTRLRFRILPARTGGSGFDGCMSYVASYPLNSPANLNELCEEADSVYFWGQQTTHSTLNVSKAALSGGVPVWYKTRTAIGIDSLAYQGALTVGDETGASATYTVFMDYVIEFKNPVPLSLSAMKALPRLPVAESKETSVPSDDEYYSDARSQRRKPKR